MTYDDPRRELMRWARRAGLDPMTAVPVDLLLAAARFRECHAQRVMTSDEDGIEMEPVTALCRRGLNHLGPHSDGYWTWEAEAL